MSFLSLAGRVGAIVWTSTTLDPVLEQGLKLEDLSCQDQGMLDVISWNCLSPVVGLCKN